MPVYYCMIFEKRARSLTFAFPTGLTAALCILFITMVSTTLSIPLIPTNCLVSQVSHCERVPTQVYPSLTLIRVMWDWLPLFSSCYHHSSIHHLPSRNSLKSFIWWEGALSIAGWSSLFKCFYCYFSVPDKSSVLNLPSLIRHYKLSW